MIAILMLGAPARGATLTFHPSQDNSIYSEADRSNGLGSLYAGRAPTGNIRRALLQFDLATGGIPAGSIINSVTLSLTQMVHSNQLTDPTSIFELDPLQAAWGEGTSNGTGAGGAATTGDATWHHRFFNSSTWTHPGGDFGLASGTAILGTDDLLYTFNSQPGLVADVQSWLDTPGVNHGWMLRSAGDDTSAKVTGRVFGSRQTVGALPTLTVTYTPAPEPGTGSLLLAGLMVGAGRRFRRSAIRPRESAAWC